MHGRDPARRRGRGRRRSRPIARDRRSCAPARTPPRVRRVGLVARDVHLARNRRRFDVDERAHGLDRHVGPGELAVGAGDHDGARRPRREGREVDVVSRRCRGSRRPRAGRGDRRAAASPLAACRPARSDAPRARRARACAPSSRSPSRSAASRSACTSSSVSSFQRSSSQNTAARRHRRDQQLRGVVDHVVADTAFGHHDDRHAGEPAVDGERGRVVRGTRSLDRARCSSGGSRSRRLSDSLRTWSISRSSRSTIAPFDDRGAHEDAEPEREEHGDERDDVESEVDHGAGIEPTRRLRRHPVMECQTFSTNHSRKPSTNTCSDCDAKVITIMATSAEPTSSSMSRRRIRPS